MATDVSKGLTGFRDYRLDVSDPYYIQETAFHLAFAEKHQRHPDSHRFWNEMIGLPETIDVTPYERRLICSVIQWLGTPVGQAFLIEASTKADELRAALPQSEVEVRTQGAPALTADADFFMHM